MVYGEIPLPNGQIQRMTEVEISRPANGIGNDRPGGSSSG
jgi:hypothetical protein